MINLQSQFGQDRFVDQCVFSQKSNGVFLDIGAHDGVTFSNSFFLEQERGWTGICVEPNPRRFEELQVARSSLCLHGCVSSSSGVTQLVVDLQADMLSRMVECASLGQACSSANVVTVPCFTPAQVIAQLPGGHCDYCSIDTEGHELTILQSFPFEKCRPTCFTIEDNQKALRIILFMIRKGYRLVERLGPDLVFVDAQHAQKMSRVGFLRPGALALRLVKASISRVRRISG